MKARKTLGELAEDITVGYVGSMATEYIENGIPFLRSLNVKPYCYDPSDIKYVSREFHNKIKKSALKPGDVVAVRTGNPGASCVIPEELPEANCSDLVIIRCGEKLDPYFVSYYINSVTHSHVKNQLVGAIQKHFNIGSAKELPFPDLEKEQQAEISSVLRSIDQKIELNNRVNAELEAMAKTLYDYWFVQFDFPDENGKPYKASGGKMVYNEVLKREIPEEWGDTTIGKLESDIITGKTPPKKKTEYFDGDVPFITIGDIRDNTFIVDTEKTLTIQGADSQSNKYLPEDAICVTCIASPGLVGFVTERSQTNQQINTVDCKKEYNRYFLFFSIKAYFSGAKAKTGNTFANMNKGDFSDIVLTEPDENILKLFHQHVFPMFSQIKVHSKENSKLKKLRDWLLPMLMSGQVTVN
ncbi:TPA: restriction endonuclease subunit S [Vibrio alginolyticus]|uniref:restriction endonuclease subunit S n=1 Tax=Vibrio alginolyticus TaxID=663 RepID=UPI003E115F7F